MGRAGDNRDVLAGWMTLLRPLAGAGARELTLSRPMSGAGARELTLLRPLAGGGRPGADAVASHVRGGKGYR